MRKVLIILSLATLVSVLPSCKKFLEQSSPDLIRPVTVEHYKELLQGEAYFKDFYKVGWFVDVMTDDVSYLDLGPASTVNAKAEASKYAFQWGPDLEAPTGTFTDRLFQHLYKNILAANTCLESIDGMEGTEAERQVLKGQASFTRAYGYFVLANLYAQAFNEAADDDLCVPLITETTPSLKGYNRATVKEVWDLITNDITTAVTCLSEDRMTRNMYEIGYKAALLLASRVFLYKEEYDKVIEYGERFLLLQPALRDISGVTVSPSSGGTIAPKNFMYPASNPELVFTFSRFSCNTCDGNYLYYLRDPTLLSPTSYSASFDSPSSLIDSYGPDDRRKTYWFVPPAPSPFLGYLSYSPMKLNYYDGDKTSQYMRGAEVYLNVAEAYTRKASPDNNKAISLLNQLRSKRIGNYTNLSAADFTGQPDLVSFVWQERRRELCFEEFHRWWDLRRTGQPALTHELLGDVYELQAKDPAYILTFPRSEMEFNPGLEPNPRPERNAE